MINKLKEELRGPIILLVCYILIAVLLLIISINASKKTFDIEPLKSEWYICQEDVPLCQEEQRNNCLSYKLICDKCCDEGGLI